MRFLRMLTNSLLAGALGAAFLTIIVLQLNPGVPLASSTTWRLFLTLGLFYGVHLSVVFYLLMVAREFVGFAPMSPGLGQRPDPGVAFGCVIGGGLDADVAQCQRAVGDSRRDRSAADDGGRGGDDRNGNRTARPGGSALFVWPARQPRWRGASHDRGLWIAGAADRRARARRRGAAATRDDTRRRRHTV